MEKSKGVYQMEKPREQEQDPTRVLYQESDPGWRHPWHQRLGGQPFDRWPDRSWTAGGQESDRWSDNRWPGPPGQSDRYSRDDGSGRDTGTLSRESSRDDLNSICEQQFEYEDRFRVDRRKLELMMVGNLDIGETAG